MYGNCKVHKQQVDGCPPFRPILSALQTPTYNLAQFLVPILNLLTKNEYTVKDSFQFAEENVSKKLHYLWVVQMLTYFLLTFLLIKLLIFASISSLKTLILQKALQNQNLNNYYLSLQRSLILYLKVYVTHRLMVQQWAHLLDLPLLTHFCHTMKKTG